MIKVEGFEIKPTIFPDGTQQVWKLDNEILNLDKLLIDWRYEADSEFFTIAQLNTLFISRTRRLYVPYLPYARQDKQIKNDSTFGLYTFGYMLNGLGFDSVFALDVHNPKFCNNIISNFANWSIASVHSDVIKKVKPDLIVFPDLGARKRYPHLHSRPFIAFDKLRDPINGKIVGHQLIQNEGEPRGLNKAKQLLIVDDICDGGATFLSIVDVLNKKYEKLKYNLFVTHGLFSKGRKVLEAQGIRLFTTNSLPRNEKDGYPV